MCLVTARIPEIICCHPHYNCIFLVHRCIWTSENTRNSNAHMLEKLCGPIYNTRVGWIFIANQFQRWRIHAELSATSCIFLQSIINTLPWSSRVDFEPKLLAAQRVLEKSFYILTNSNFFGLLQYMPNIDYTVIPQLITLSGFWFINQPNQMRAM